MLYAWRKARGGWCWVYEIKLIMAFQYPPKLLKTDISLKSCPASFSSNKKEQLHPCKGKGGVELIWISVDSPSGLQGAQTEVFKSLEKCFQSLYEGRGSPLSAIGSGRKSVFTEPLKHPFPITEHNKEQKLLHKIWMEPIFHPSMLGFIWEGNRCRWIWRKPDNMLLMTLFTPTAAKMNKFTEEMTSSWF